MKLVVLISSLKGFSSTYIPVILQSKTFEISMVIFNEGGVVNKRKYYGRILRKVFSIGLLGALNGIRMRKWYNVQIQDYMPIQDMEEVCRQYNIPFYKVSTINSDETIGLFEKANADLGLSLGNGYIGKKIFSIPHFGMLNIHHELLPEYQNAQSVIWQIYNGSSKTGYTIHKINAQIDTGDILYREDTSILFKDTLSDTVSTTYVSLHNLSSKGLLKVLDNFEEYYNKARPQGKGKKYTTPNIWQYIKILFNFKKLKTRS